MSNEFPHYNKGHCHCYPIDNHYYTLVTLFYHRTLCWTIHIDFKCTHIVFIYCLRFRRRLWFPWPWWPLSIVFICFRWEFITISLNSKPTAQKYTNCEHQRNTSQNQKGNNLQLTKYWKWIPLHICTPFGLFKCKRLPKRKKAQFDLISSLYVCNLDYDFP
jgi:hypothetical protein